MSNYVSLKRTINFTLLAFATFSATGLYMTADIYAHNFTPNESAQFLALMQLIKTEANLAALNQNNNNINLSDEHIDTAIVALTPDILNEIEERNERIANELNTSLLELKESVTIQQQNTQGQDLNSTIDEINAIIEEAITVRVDTEQRNNATIQALAFANIIDEILTNYGDAYAVDFDMTNMTNIVGMSMDNSSIGMGFQNNDIVQMADYQTAAALSSIAQDIFNKQIKPNFPEGSTYISKLETSLTELKSKIDSKASPMEIMRIIHTNVHPNLQTAFNLPLKQ